MSVETIAVRMVSDTSAFTTGMAGSIVQLGMLRTAMIGVMGATQDLVSKTVELAINYQLAGVQFGVMVGSLQEGARILEDINQLAIRSPFTSDQLIKSANMLLGFGTSLNSLLPTMERLTDIAAGNELRLRRITLAFGQVIAAGRLYGTELRQFTEAGIGVADFAKTAGMSAVQFRAAMEAGRIGPNVVIETMNRLTSAGGRFAGMNEKVTGTVKGQWNALIETIDLFLAKLGVSAFEKLNVGGGIATLAAAFDSIKGRSEGILDWMSRGQEPAEKLLMILLEIGFAIKQMAEYASQFVPSWGEVGAGLDKFESSLPIIAAGFQSVMGSAAKMGAVVLETFTAIIRQIRLIGDVAEEWGRTGILGPGGTAFAAMRQGTGTHEVLQAAEDAGNHVARNLRIIAADINNADFFAAMQEAIRQARAFANGLRDSNKVLAQKSRPVAEGLGALIGPGVLAGIGIVPKPAIPTPLGLSPTATQMAMGGPKALSEMMSPLEKFSNDIAALDQAMFGPGGMAGAALGGIGIGMAAGGGMLSPEEYDASLLGMFRSLEKSVSTKEPDLPHAMLRDSQEAAATIAKAQQGQVTEQERVRAILERANEMAEEKAKNDKEVLEELKRLNQKGGLGLKKGDIK